MAFAQQLRLGLGELHPLLIVQGGGLLQVLARLGQLALLGEDAGITRLGIDVLLALGHGSVPLERFVEALAFLVQLPEVIARDVRILVIQLQHALQLRIGRVVIAGLDREQRDRHGDIRVLRVLGYQRLELLARLGIVLGVDQQASVVESHVARLGMSHQVFTQIAHRFLFGAAGEHLGDEQRGDLPVRLELQRRPRLVEGRLLLVRIPGRLRHRKPGLGHFGIGFCQRLHQLEYLGLVLVARQQRIQLEEVRADILAVGGEPLLEMRLGFGELRLVDQQRGNDLARLRRTGVGLQPDARGFQRRSGEARVPRHLGRALRDARVAGLARELEIGLHRDVRLPALHRDFRQHDLEHQILGEVDAGQQRGCAAPASPPPHAAMA